MCDWCDENGGEPISCQDCGRMICWDVEVGVEDDVLTRPYVTASGDVFCFRCGSRYDEAEEEAADEEYDGWDYYPASWYDPDMDFENEESNGVYIGEDQEPDDEY